MDQVRIELSSKSQLQKASQLCEELKTATKVPLDKIRRDLFYKIEGSDLKSPNFKNDCIEIFCDPIIQDIHFDAKDIPRHCNYIVEVSFKAGVTDNPALSAKDALNLLKWDVKVSSGALYYLFGDFTKDDAVSLANEMLGNSLIQDIKVYDIEEFSSDNRFSKVKLPKVYLDHDISTKIISLEIDDRELEELSTQRCLALTLNEMKFIQTSFRNHFSKDIVRSKKGLTSSPTDLELEVIAQSWSEHCKHKIFSANINFKSEKNGKVIFKRIQGLYPSYIKKSTNEIKAERKIEWLKSVFSDNAGIVRFDNNVDLCIKVETHNSPSALDPYGGALTGILGVNRDILGCGMGAKPIANTDVFCLGPIDETLEQHPDKQPIGLKHPKQILKGVHKGIEDGGNKSGIPTVNGAIYHDLDYSGKPLIFCGTVGVLPQDVKKYDKKTNQMKIVPSFEKKCSPGDLVVMVGGAIGADGIHGATFSSLELDENSPSTAVQIGDPLTQKRMTDFLLEARDLGLYTCITDNGAGGLSSSVGEMATITGGAAIDLAQCPVKYPGLKPYELMISESQERMTLAVAQETWTDFVNLAKKRGVEATCIGHFNSSGYLTIAYGDQVVGCLNLGWLHDGLPAMELEANWNGPTKRNSWFPEQEKFSVKFNQTNYAPMFEHLLKTLLATPNIASKEKWVRQYDHEVQGATHIKPFVGPKDIGPSDSGVIWLAPHGGEATNGVGIGCGLAPRVSLYNPYLMAQFSVDEAIRNVVATGGDIDHSCLLDNFCWPDPVLTKKNPGGDEKLGQLVLTCEGLYDICKAYGTPLVSGKDSMKNDFKGKNQLGEEIKISVLPTLLVTAMSKTKVTESVSSPFKKSGDLIYLLGKRGNGLLGSELLEINHLTCADNHDLPEIDLVENYKIYKTMKSGFEEKIFQSVHDISDGGLLAAISESAIGGDLGVSLDLPFDVQANQYFLDMCNILFNEAPGRFIVSVSPDKKEIFENLFMDLPKFRVGEVTTKKDFIVQWGNQEILRTDVNSLESSWRN